jgi:hypothetical protein
MVLLSVRRRDDPQPDEAGENEVAFVQVFTRRMRSLDFATRMSDGRYCVCMPHTDVSGAESAAARLSQEIGESRVIVGIAEYDAGRDVTSLIERAFASIVSSPVPPAPVDFASGPDQTRLDGPASAEEVAATETAALEDDVVAPETVITNDDTADAEALPGKREDYPSLVARVRAEESGQIELSPSESRRDVKNRLRRAAKRAGVVLQLRDGDGAVYFQRLSRLGGAAADERVA